MKNFNYVNSQINKYLEMFNFELIVYDEVVEFGNPGTKYFNYPYSDQKKHLDTFSPNKGMRF